MILEKSLIEELGGYPPYQLNQDVWLSKKLQPYIHEESDTILPPTTIYRHLRADKTYKRAVDYPHQKDMNHEAQKKFIADDADERIKKGIEPIGDIVIEPKWSRNWALFSENMWSELKKS